jgi:GntR family transcriptional regulator
MNAVNRPVTGCQPGNLRVLYRQVVEKLLAKIESGHLGVGDSLPPEPRLAEQYLVSRHTVREALRILREMGVVDRRPGAGTVIKARKPQPLYLQVIRSPQELLQYPASVLHVQGSRFVRSSRKLASLLQCRTGERWFHVQAVRCLRSGPTPICWLDLYLVPEYSGVLPLIGKRDQPVYEMILEKYGEQTASVSVDLGVSRISAAMAGPLLAKAGEPSLRVVRRYGGTDKRTFQISVSEHPADRYNYRLQLQYDLNTGAAWSAGTAAEKTRGQAHG